MLFKVCYLFFGGIAFSVMMIPIAIDDNPDQIELFVRIFILYISTMP